MEKRNVKSGIIYQWWFRHLIFWIVMVAYLTWGFGIIANTLPEAFFKSITLNLASMIVVYPLLYVLIPKFLVKRKFIMFFFALAVLLVSATFFREYIYDATKMQVIYDGFKSKIGNSLLPYINIAAFATSMKLIRHVFLQKEKAESAVHEKTLAEIELLKSQIQPHFLFNTLKSLYARTMENSTESPGIVITLSDLLRFMIYESKAEFIDLVQEIQLLKNYVALEKLRFGDDVEISLSFSGDTEGKRIRPLLLLPLLENCFKHGTRSDIETKWISLNLNVNKNSMNFTLMNSHTLNHAQNANHADTEKGISLENVKRRLELLYPGQYTLMIREEEDYFLLKLSLKLKKSAEVHKLKSEQVAYDIEMSAS